MGIPKDEFKRIQDADDSITVYEEGTNPHNILQFLSSNQDRAFKPKEIADATDIPASSVRVTLTRLRSKNLVEHADQYWSINERELGTQRAALVSQRAIESHQYGGYDRTEETEYADFPPDRHPRNE